MLRSLCYGGRSSSDIPESKCLMSRNQTASLRNQRLRLEANPRRPLPQKRRQ
jgi:hypothetical protein